VPQDPKAARDAIVALLEKASSLRQVKKWKKAEPPRGRWPGFPWGWVEWVSGPVSPSTMSASKKRYEDRYFVVVVDRHVDEEKAEDEAVDLMKSVETVLESDYTLDGKVETSYVVNREKVKFFEGDYSMVAVRLTLYTRSRE